MIADTSDIHAFSVAQHWHADDLTAIAADLAAAQVSPDAFGCVGADFVATLNDAVTREADRVTQFADRMAAATAAAGQAADAYRAAETHAGQSISLLGG
jgi:hypothetical protein